MIGQIRKNILKELAKQNLVSPGFDSSMCSHIILTPEMISQAKKYKSSEDFLRSGGFDIDILNRAAFGFDDTLNTINPKDLNIKWKQDYENVKYEILHSKLSKKDWAKNISLEEPVDVFYSKGKFWLDDGHHRYFAAKTLGKILKMNLDIRSNPIEKLSNLDYDNFHRCAWLQAQSSSDVISENDAQTLIDVISMNPEKYGKYKEKLKSEFNIDFDKIYKDEFYIENASLDSIKDKKDFLNFDNYIIYAKKIFQLRKLGAIQPNHIDKVISFEDMQKISEQLNFKLIKSDNNANGNYASHDLNDVIKVPGEIDVNTFIHELGHHFDHNYMKEYEGLAKTITYASSPYFISKSNEVFAENFMHFFIAPNFLKDNLPEVFQELNKNIPEYWKKIIFNIL